jgi:nucleotide-binding universal stress UspA family protein
MFKRMVVGTDGSETADQAVRQACELARIMKAALHVVTAYRAGVSGMAERAGAALVAGGAEDALRQENAEQVVRQAALRWARDLPVQTHALPGDAADVIVGVAGLVGADLVVVGSKGMQGPRRILGSVPNSVCHSAPCAVLVVKTDQEPAAAQAVLASRRIGRPPTAS